MKKIMKKKSLLIFLKFNVNKYLKNLKKIFTNNQYPYLNNKIQFSKLKRLSLRPINKI